jgi:23S rRNA pseudouridine1911/1915/1917 synthase
VSNAEFRDPHSAFQIAVKRLVVGNPEDLKHFLAGALGISGGKAKELIDARNVLVNSQRVWIATHLLRHGDVVEIAGQTAAQPPNRRELAILFQDAHAIAVNKPAGLVSDQSPDSVESLLRKQQGDPHLRAIHRQDRDTTGVLLFARTEAAFEEYKNLWREHRVEKIYRAICYNPARFRQTRTDQPIEGRPASSEITVLAKSRGYSYCEIRTRTGRKHQVRVHLAALHHPVVGDKQYGAKVITDPAARNVARQLLHCYRIALPQLPALSIVSVTAQLPADFRQAGIRFGLIHQPR